MNFDFDEIGNVTFGVCTRLKGEIEFFDVQVDDGVHNMLREMTVSTWARMLEVADDPTDYEPTERYSGDQHLFVGLDESSVEFFNEIHGAVNFDPGGNILREPRLVFCYFAKLDDYNGNRLTAVRRSSLFKGVLKQKNRILALADDRLRVMEDDLFRLDHNFDVLVDDDEVHILNASGFELLGSLQDAIRDAAGENVQALQASLPFVDMGLGEPQGTFTVSLARRLAAVKKQRLGGITVDSLRTECQRKNVAFTETQDGLRFEEDALVGLLDILDRRRFVDELVPGEAVQYKADSRQRLA